MIPGAIILVIYTVLAYTIGLLPSSPSLGLNTIATGIAGDSIWGHLGWANAYFPLDDLVTAVGVVLTLYGVFYGIQLVLWLLRLLHILGNDD